MSQNNNDKKPKPIIDKAIIDQSIKDKQATIATNQTVKK